jgi:hypothetical protein
VPEWVGGPGVNHGPQWANSAPADPVDYGSGAGDTVNSDRLEGINCNNVGLTIFTGYQKSVVGQSARWQRNTIKLARQIS